MVPRARQFLLFHTQIMRTEHYPSNNGPADSRRGAHLRFSADMSSNAAFRTSFTATYLVVAVCQTYTAPGCPRAAYATPRSSLARGGCTVHLMRSALSVKSLPCNGDEQSKRLKACVQLEH